MTSNAAGGATAPVAVGPAWGSALGGARGALRRWIARFAARAPARVFVLEGADPSPALAALRLRDDVLLLDSPRSATVLLIAGDLPELLREAARRTHDALAHPRATVWWRRDQGSVADPFPGAIVVSSAAAGAETLDEVATAVTQVHRELVSFARASEPALLPDVDPAPWRGVGSYGQGGAGMTGGVPYGRPMTGRAPDRDGLELDQLPVRVGPFFAPFPAGLVLDVRFQGDVVQEVVVPGNPFARADEDAAAGEDAPGDGAGPTGPRAAPIETSRTIAELERVRARHHLQWLAHALRVHGLDALGRRALALGAALARGLPETARDDVIALGRLLERTRALGWATAGVGVTPRELLAGRGLGPVARAAGLAVDARAEDPAYLTLGFEPVVAVGSGDSLSVGDARARWRQRIAEAAQSLELAARGGGRTSASGVGALEGPRGRRAPDGILPPPSATLLSMLPELLRGQEWGDAVTTIVSLDIDVREVAPGAPPLRALEPPKVGGGMGAMGGMSGMGGMGGMAHGHKHGE